MSDGISTDFSELLKLAADLTAAPAKAAPKIRQALQFTATEIKNDWRRAANRTGLAGYAADVTYDTKFTATSVEAEIGPTIGDMGSFGLVEDGGGGVRSAPQHAARNAAKRAEPDFVKGLEIAIADVL